MDWLHTVFHYPFYFILLISILVFVHEFGHYLVARLCGIKIETFSIGFGPELFGWNDGHGTRWKFSLLPLGGYVKMFGDADPASRPSDEVKDMTDEEKRIAFYHQHVGKRAMVVFAGPLANYLFAILLMAVLFAVYGQPFTPTIANQVVENSPAMQAGLEPGDRILSINGTKLERFEELQQWVYLRPGIPVTLQIQRGDETLTRETVLQNVEMKDRFGNTHFIGRLGIQSKEYELKRQDPGSAVWQSLRETWHITTGTLTAVWQIIKGERSTEDLGGPLRIAQMAGDTADMGMVPWVMLMVMISINLGLINLFPIPVLDGGHLLFYGLEALQGKAISIRAQEWGMRVGLSLVMLLMVFALWNDFTQLKIFDFLHNRLF